jgi:hypothetical protein
MRTILSIVGLSLLMVAAYAATSDSWNNLDKNAREACNGQIAKLAGKAQIDRVTGRVSGIGVDGDRYYALVMAGKTAGYPSQWLCLYDKRIKTTQAREIEPIK